MLEEVKREDEVRISTLGIDGAGGERRVQQEGRLLGAARPNLAQTLQTSSW